MRFALACTVFCAAILSLAPPPPAKAETSRPRSESVLSLKVKSFSCSAQLRLTTEYLKQKRSETQSYACQYECVEDFSLTCKDAGEACPKLVATNFDNRRYELAGKGRGNSVGLDVASQRKGGIERRTGELHFVTEERHTFESDLIFLKSYVADGSCRPATAAEPKRAAKPVQAKNSRSVRWREE